MTPGPLIVIREQFNKVGRVPETNLTGRVIIVTGGNTGLGYEAAKYFAAMQPAQLILAVRNPAKGKAAKEKLVAATKCDASTIHVWQLDMASFDSVSAFASKVQNECSRLDILLCNAGISSPEWETTKDQYESQLQVNVISTGLLSLLLLPMLNRTAGLPALAASPNFRPHLCIPNTSLHVLVTFPEQKDAHPIAALNDQSLYKAGGWDRYSTTKLLVVFLTRELAKRATTGVIVNTSNPGFCKSDLGGNSLGKTIGEFVLARSTEEGGRCLVHGCIADVPNGSYLAHGVVWRESDFANSKAGFESQSKVWSDLCTIWQKESSQAKEILRGSR